MLTIQNRFSTVVNCKWTTLYLTLSFLVISQPACKKLVDVSPPITSITGGSVFSTDANAIGVLTGVYSGIEGYGFTANLNSISLYPGLSADELSLYSASSFQYLPYYTNNLFASSSVTSYWNIIYPMLYTINSALSGISSATTLTPAIQKQLMGEAKFMRAFCYFYLVNLYGDVPLVLGTDYTANAVLARTPQAKVYQQMVADLKDAKNLLSPNYLDASLVTITSERTRPTKGAAQALLSRVYLYTSDWQNAALESDSVLNATTNYALDSLGGTFRANSTEAIWQLQPVATTGGSITADALFFLLPASGPGSVYPVYMNNNLVNSFETGDNRKQNWTGNVTVSGITYYYPRKYKQNLPTTTAPEYEMVFRLGEVYLIRAEARAQQKNLGGAVSDLDTIRVRAGLPAINPVSQAAVLAAIYHERQVELFTEWGHRWLDLKRTGLIDATMDTVAPQKGGTWASYKQWYPIPLNDIVDDINLVQNQGY